MAKRQKTQKTTTTRDVFDFRYRLYPWDEWFKKAAKRPVELVRGEDFHCQPHGLAQQIRNKASSLGVSARVRIDGDKVFFQLNQDAGR